MKLHEINPPSNYRRVSPMQNPSLGNEPRTDAPKPAIAPEPQTTMEPEAKIDPAMEKELDAAIAELGDHLKSMVSATPPGRNAMKSLPWFGGGARGFLRKLWYGNSPENPDWSNWNKPQGEGRARKGVTVREYAMLDEQLDIRINALLDVKPTSDVEGGAGI